MRLRHYIKPVSLTWGISFVSLATGAFIASEPMHGLGAAVDTVANMTNGMTPYELIAFGLAGIGGRAAVSKIEEKVSDA